MAAMLQHKELLLAGAAARLVTDLAPSLMIVLMPQHDLYTLVRASAAMTVQPLA
jgi:hypothetical protein